MPHTSDKAIGAIVDATLPIKGDPPPNSGIPALDAALRDPRAKAAIGATTIASAATGVVGGLVVGGVVGAGVMGLAWALWPKKKR